MVLGRSSNFIHSTLGSVTQVASSSELHLLHNRLTHSEKVAQVGRRLTQSLQHRFPDIAKDQGLDPDLTEAAGLAHDLGHPPFGHIAEKELDALLSNCGGFEGNAQTFRIVTKVGFKKPTKKKRETRDKLTGFDLMDLAWAFHAAEPVGVAGYAKVPVL